jgi:SAM-dependent methyltransferase
MLGSTLDYYLLRPLAHAANRATEEKLDAQFRDASPETFEAAMPKLRKLVARFEGALEVRPGLRYLDIGCGTGELTLALARMGAEHVTGVDILPRAIERARAYARDMGLEHRVEFVCRDVHAWAPREKFDVLLSFDAFEHIDEPRALLAKMADLVAPGGMAAVSFGPLFHSPFGDHMWDFFRVQIPWRGQLFNEQAMLRLRREFFRPTDPARRYREIAGGLNQLRYSDFLRHVRESGWRWRSLAPNAFLPRGSLPRRFSDAISVIPGIRDYAVHCVYATLVHPSSHRNG